MNNELKPMHPEGPYERGRQIRGALTSLLMQMAMMAEQTPIKGTPKDRIGGTKKGARHIVGKHFKPRFVTKIKVKLDLYEQPQSKYVTPALYRRLHLGAKNGRTRNPGKVV